MEQVEDGDNDRDDDYLRRVTVVQVSLNVWLEVDMKGPPSDLEALHFK